MLAFLAEASLAWKTLDDAEDNIFHDIALLDCLMILSDATQLMQCQGLLMNATVGSP